MANKIETYNGGVQWKTGASAGMTLGIDGNLGLGVAPSAWGSNYKAIEMAGASLSSTTTGGTASISQNTYYNGTSWIYKATGTSVLYQQGAGSSQHVWFTAPSGTAGNAIPWITAMTLDASGKLSVAGGVSVGNVSNASATALDWYEEGTFTPTIAGTTTAGVGTYTRQQGEYTRVGNTVFFRVNVIITAHTGTGNMVITGLPFVVNNTTNYYPIFQALSNNLTHSSGALQAYTAYNTTTVVLSQEVSGSTQVAVPLDAACDVSISGFYRV